MKHYDSDISQALLEGPDVLVLDKVEIGSWETKLEFLGNEGERYILTLTCEDSGQGYTDDGGYKEVNVIHAELEGP